MTPTIHTDFDLTTLTTFGLRSTARRYAEAASLEDLRALFADARLKGEPVRLLGGGANVIAGRTVEGLVVRVALTGMEVEAHPEGGMALTVGAGERLDDVVRKTLLEGWGGMEGLAAVPGTVGGAVVQNAGAYGVEVAEVLEWVEVWNPETDEVKRMSTEECDFGYRTSVFKTPEGEKLVILRAGLIVGRGAAHPKTDYKDLAQELERSGADPKDPLAVEAAVRALRARKLPETATVGNAGSFFKNPIVTQVKARQLRTDYPMLVVYPLAGARVKLAAGWLIQEAGFKGAVRGPVGVSENHALILVNKGGADAEDVKALRDEIVAAVEKRFGVTLEPEPVFWD